MESADANASDLFHASGAPNTLFLTWQRDPTTTMTVQWLAPETGGQRAIQCRSLTNPAPISATVALKPYPNTELKVHRAELTGLAPGTEYEFQIGAESPVYRSQTMPAKATDTIQFVSGGDSGVDEHAVANNILAAKQDPHFALIGGDLAYDNGRSPETFTQFLKNYHTMPIWWTPAAA